MSAQLHTLHNDFWQAGILPGTGASIACGRVRQSDNTWRDVLRPMPEAAYDNASKASSFIMLPWCNRIAGALLRFEGQEYQLKPEADDGTARHGDVRKRPWVVEAADDTHIVMSFDSAQHEHVNFPWHFSAAAEYRLDGQRFVWRLALKNEDTRRMPGGFGHHPYFVRSEDVEVLIPCESQFKLEHYLAVAPPVPLEPSLDFGQFHTLRGDDINDLLTQRREGEPARLRYPDWHLELSMSADPLFQHILLYTPPGEPSYAVEPMTNASDGFNLHERGIAESGVFVLEPGQSVSGDVVLTGER
jgi:aldose 1-epimerase